MPIRLLAPVTALFLALTTALTVTQTGTLATVAVTIATVAFTSAVSAALVVVLSREVTTGARSTARRQAHYEVPAPSHPTTAGRPRTRAPSGALAA